ncbi:MAG: response regulator [Pseudomonadota bacterium]
MLTYIVEDSPLKAELLGKFLIERFPILNVHIAGSYQSGLKLIEKESPGLIILDMTLPNFDRLPNAREGRLRPIGGYDMMRKIKLREVQTRIIVVTQLESFGEGEDEVSFEEMAARCATEFSQTYVGSVYFDQREAAWQDELENYIKKVIAND